MKTIIAPTDFSPVSLNAVNFAADMAVALDASLLLFNAAEIPLSYGDMPVALISVEEVKKNSEDELEKLKKSLVHIASGNLKVYTETIIGNTIDELEALCKKIQPLAVVMGAKGRSAVENVIFGSTALGAIRHIKWPVICVPPGKEFGNGIKKIGFACDLRDVIASTPATMIRTIVSAFKAELHVINVDHNNKHFKPETPEESLALHQLLEGLKPQYHFIENKDVEEGINEFAETNNMDLLITIPRKHGFVDRLLHPSHTKKLLFRSHIPVMCVHEDE